MEFPGTLTEMSLRVRRPTDAALAALARRSSGAPLTYEPVGISASGAAPTGYRRDRWCRAVGQGRRDLDTAWETLRGGGVHRGAGLAVTSPPVADGLVVGLAAPLPVGWIEIACRVVSVVEGDDRRGFAYGTLPTHPESGEESFTIELRPDGTVVFEIVAVSRLRHPLPRLAPPAARLLQRRATDRYLTAMEHALR